jgi:hypothetical protein
MSPKPASQPLFPGEPPGTIFANMPTWELIRFLHANRSPNLPPALAEALHRLEQSCQS